MEENKLTDLQLIGGADLWVGVSAALRIETSTFNIIAR
jgi:hypothetical protein